MLSDGVSAPLTVEQRIQNFTTDHPVIWFIVVLTSVGIWCRSHVNRKWRPCDDLRDDLLDF